MQTDYLDRPTHHQLDREIVLEPEPPLSVSHFMHVIRSYSAVILLSLAGVFLAYLIIALAVYLLSPVEQITSQMFRLDFEDPAAMRADLAGKPVYMALSMNENGVVRMKPQNLLLNLPLASPA